jgi:uncharacterized protein (TIGR02757 family)
MNDKEAILRLPEGLLAERLESLYCKYNDKEYIRYDPIKYVYRFEDPLEREVVALIASCLAFGRVTQIFKTMDRLLGIVGGKPLQYILTLDDAPEAQLLAFKYRFVTGSDLYSFFEVIKGLFSKYGSLGGLVKQEYRQGHFQDLLTKFMGSFRDVHYLIPCSLKGSACKRLCLYFRWMVRSDNIDTGLWDFINPRELLIPLDTHIFQVARELGFTSRRTPSLAAALEITEALRAYSENDPVKYDWALSHIGIIANNFPDVQSKRRFGAFS